MSGGGSGSGSAGPAGAVEVRDAVLADAAAIARVQVTTWRAAYAGLLPDHVLAGLSPVEHRATWEARLPVSPPTSCLVADDGTVVVGFVTSGPVLAELGSEGTGQVYALYVSPARWRAGIGGALLAAAVDHLREAGFGSATLWVLTTNAAARAFYEHEGWEATGRARVDTLYATEVPETEYARRL